MHFVCSCMGPLGIWRRLCAQFVWFNRIDLCFKSPDSDERQCNSRTWKRRFDPALRAGGTFRGRTRRRTRRSTLKPGEFGTNKTVQAGFWPWLEPFLYECLYNPISCSLLPRQRLGRRRDLPMPSEEGTPGFSLRLFATFFATFCEVFCDFYLEAKAIVWA